MDIAERADVMQPVHFALSEADVVCAQKDFWRGSASWQVFLKITAWLWLVYAALVALVYFIIDDGIDILYASLSVSAAAPIIAMCCFIVGRIITPISARKNYRQQKGLQSPATISWDQDHILIKNDYGQSNLPWNAYCAWLCSEDNIIIYQSDILYNILPAEYFSAEQLSQITQHLKAANVPQKYPFGFKML